MIAHARAAQVPRPGPGEISAGGPQHCPVDGVRREGQVVAAEHGVREGGGEAAGGNEAGNEGIGGAWSPWQIGIEIQLGLARGIHPHPQSDGIQGDGGEAACGEAGAHVATPRHQLRVFNGREQVVGEHHCGGRGRRAEGKAGLLLGQIHPQNYSRGDGKNKE